LSEIKEFLTEDNINNIYNNFSNVYVIKYNEDAKINDYFFGVLLLKVKVEKNKDKPIIVNDYVEFKSSKVKWKNTDVCLVDPKWVKKFQDNRELTIKVKVMKTKINEFTSKREYYIDYEYLNLTFKQFISRRLLEEYINESYGIVKAFENFNFRMTQVGYYKALNETCKHYQIEHEIMKNTNIPKMNNSLKKYKKEWEQLYKQNLENDKAKEAIDKIIKENQKEKKSTKVIDFTKKKQQ